MISRIAKLAACARFCVKAATRQSTAAVMLKTEPKVLVPFANGTEEIEAVTVIHCLARAGAQVTVASVDTVEGTNYSLGHRGLKIVADKTIEECREEIYDMIVLPGGNEGAEAFRDSPHLSYLLQVHDIQWKYIAAICASPPTVLTHHKLLKDRTATCFPPMRDGLDDYSDDKVVVDGHFITSQGPNTALEFAWVLVAKLFGTDKAAEILKEYEHPTKKVY